MAKINQIVVLGDSFSAGDEHLQSIYHDDFMDYINKNFPKSKLDETGKYVVHPKEKTMQSDVVQFQRQLLGSHEQVWKEQFQTTYGAYLGRCLDIPVRNFARGGNSWGGIFKNIVDGCQWWDENTLVIVGDTFPGRNTRLWPDWQKWMKDYNGNSPDKEFQSIYLYDTIFPGVLSLGGDRSSYEKYLELNLTFGDDWFFLFHDAYSKILAIKHLLKERNIPHIFINVCGDFYHWNNASRRALVHSQFEKMEEWPSMHVDMLKDLLKKFQSEYFCHTLAESSQVMFRQKRPFSQFFGHFKSNVHRHFVDEFLLQHVKDNFL